MSDLLEKPKEDVKVTNNGDHDKFQHYFPKSAINENLMTGAPMQALCGRIIEQQVDPKGRTICPECQEKYERLAE